MKRHVRTTLTAATAVALTAALAAPALAAVPGKAPGGHDATRQAVRAAVADGVPGVTVTVRRGHGTWAHAAGVGNLETGKPRSARDHYRVASITKTFVATVVLQLEAEGRLSLDDRVEKWLPGLVRGNGQDGSRITIRQLLNHTSGIFDYLEDPGFQQTYMTPDGFMKHRFDEAAPEDMLTIAMKNRPYFEPGASFAYSNTNYLLAARVIEKATGHDYGDEIDRRIIAPLHLTSTSVPTTRVTLPRPGSRAYSKLAKTDTGPTYDVTELNPRLAYGSGQMVSSSADLTRFYSALLGGRLLPREQLREMKTTVESSRETSRYGLGLVDRKLSCGVHVWGHGGGITGSNSDVATTENGRHSLAVNLNGDWSGSTDAIIEAEFCGK
ncbi:D-alanyl-D-alanine carboxypeptidase [Streptomyces sp. Ag82_O1-12]|uniref:serine hydrolase domain-containing protein n=1 Tax=unclassified Streptomyces TaxID=2593676 RepID=UPI000BC60496|nr:MULTISPECIES: serine hydrolase domain-containing protein [unclassified Streptomyces]SMQ16313.1 D-alanyl-D-alanine carboxypeptidase [Streptomyces sp. Ag82_O1-12]SOD45343.1 D-alanyl-D-alanine carboxypeptidase [Streptomyces sp. Ag82_G6-1]